MKNITNQHTYQKLIDTLNQSIDSDFTENKYASILEKIGDARFVLIGEATHGSKEFYQIRAEITQQLIEQKGFMAIAIEGDWPDAYQIHRYLFGTGKSDDWEQALSQFKRFPMWMWRNEVIPPFIQRLRNYNDSLNINKKKIGFYGLDLYSLYSSIHAVINYLEKIDPEAAARARKRYGCFEYMKIDAQTYGYLASSNIKKSCLDEAIQQLLEIQNHAFDYVKKDDLSEDEYFFATQNARLIKNAENYYRSMFESHVSSWNVRDHHMAETVRVLSNHLENRFERPAKIVIWAHNSHVGDARATEMGMRGEVNIGQLIKEEFEESVYSIGFSTYHGTVTAAYEWDSPPECKEINAGLRGSYEELFHELKHKNFLLTLRNNQTVDHYLQLPRLQRAIGVIYRPETERESHYFLTKLPYQFDSIIHIDKTTALKPLD